MTDPTGFARDLDPPYIPTHDRTASPHAPTSSSWCHRCAAAGIHPNTVDQLFPRRAPLPAERTLIHQQRLLAQALGNLLVAFGGVNAQGMTGPELLLLAQDLTEHLTHQHASTPYLRGILAAETVFDALFRDPDWDGQVSMGFASTFAQEIDRLRDRLRDLPTQPFPADTSEDGA